MLKIFRIILFAFASCVALVLASTPANATKRWGYLIYATPDSTPAGQKKVWVSGIFEWDWDDFDRTWVIRGRYRDFVIKNHGATHIPNTMGEPASSGWNSPEDAKSVLEKAKRSDSGYQTYIETGWTPGTAAAPSAKMTTEEAQSAAAGEASHPKKTKAQADAEFAEKMAAYEREMEQHRRAVAEADRRKAEYEKALADARRRATKEYQDWQRRKAACEGGDHTQCAALVTRQ